MKTKHVALTSIAILFAIGDFHTYGQVDDFVEFPSGARLRIVKGDTGENGEHFDPNTTGNPLLDVSGANANLLLSKNFKVAELSRSGKKQFDIARIDPELVKCLQAIRDHVKKPVIINSGYRSFSYHQDVYSKQGQEVTKSRHISGQAADIRVDGMTGMELAKTVIDAYGTNIGLGIAENYIHVDVRGEWAKWTYLSGAASDAALKEIQKYRNSRR